MPTPRPFLPTTIIILCESRKRSVSVPGSVNFCIRINYWQQNNILVHKFALPEILFSPRILVTLPCEVMCQINPDLLCI